MKTKDYAVGMAAYNAWMNERVYACCEELSDEDRRRDLGAFFKSIHATLNHILLADEAWLQRFLGLPVTMTSPTQELHTSFTELRHARRSVDQQILAWAETLPDAFADAPFGFHSVVYATDRVIPGWAAIAHLFNHQTHHRGQITTLLKQLGKDPGVTDLHMMPHFDSSR